MAEARSHVLVTGGAGYIGSHLVRGLLAARHQVRVLDSLAVGNGTSLGAHWGDPSFEFVRGDVRDPAIRQAAVGRASAVVHLAAIVGDPACARDEGAAWEVNHLATRALLHEARSAGCERFVFASTCSNYGRLTDIDAIATEGWELRPLSVYAETKVAAELDVLAASAPGFATTCLRLSTVYGASPRMRFDLTVNEFTRDALLTGALVVYGEQFWRPYVHVRDAARAIATALQAPSSDVAGQVFNVGDNDQQFRKRDLVDLLMERLPETVVERVHVAEDPRDYRVSFDKVRETFDFRITKTVPQGMDEVIGLLRSGAIQDPFADDHRN